MVVPTFMRQALTDDPITVCGSGEQTRCFAYVQDVVEALVRVMRAPNVTGEVINVGSDKEISISELAQMVREATGSASAIVHVPYAEAYGDGFADMYRRVPCLQKLTSLIGYRPDTPLRRVMKIIAASMRSHAAVGGRELQTTC